MSRYDDLEAAEMLLASAAKANADADPAAAERDARLAHRLASSHAAHTLVSRAALQISMALSNRDRLRPASLWALRSYHEAARGSRDGFVAAAQLFETWEIRGHLEAAAVSYQLLERELPDRGTWAAELRVQFSNHGLSIAAKLGDDELGEIAIDAGRIEQHYVEDDDHRSAWLQWLMIYRARRQPWNTEEAASLLEESDRLRASTPKRKITWYFPHGHLAALLGDFELAARLLAEGCAQARCKGLARYARAGESLQRELLGGGEPTASCLRP